MSTADPPLLLRASIASELQWTGGEEEEGGDAGLVSPSPTAEAASLLSVTKEEIAIRLCQISHRKK